MMNRPRPRKIINVIKTSPSAEESIPDAETNDKLEFNSFSQSQSPNQNKPASPVVPLFASVPATMSADSTASPPSTSNFITRKPIVATLRKATTIVPPPPTFSDSFPKSLVQEQGSEKDRERVSYNKFPTQPIETTHFNEPTQTEPTQIKPSTSPIQHTHNTQNTQQSIQNSPVLSPKSSGEAFLDAADKAADFIGGALLNSFNSFNLSDRSTVKFQDSEKQRQMDDNPFADIMKKLKSPVQEPEPPQKQKPADHHPVPVSFANLMDEQPPQSFNDKFKTDDEVAKGAKKPMKRAEPSSFIKAAFSPKEKEITSLTEPINLDVYKPAESTTESNVYNVYQTTELITEYSTESVVSKSTISESTVSESMVSESTVSESTVSESTVSESTVSESTVSESIADSFVSEPAEFKTETSSDNVADDSYSAATVDSTVSESSVATVSESSNLAEESEYEPQVPFSSPDSSNTPLTIPFFDSIPSSINSTSSSSAIRSPNVPASPRTGFRASILRQGLSALEMIGKSTADAVVSTRNKLANNEQLTMPSMSSQVITPDYSDESATFYEILKLYGGFNKLQELQLRGVRASIAMKLARKNESTSKFCTFDHQMRLKQQREISSLLHPDRIMENIDTKSEGFYPILASVSDDSDEIFCIQKLLKSLDNIVIMESSSSFQSNKRRHVICQVATVLCTLLIKASSGRRIQIDPLLLAKEVSLLTAQIIKYLQTNFDLNCESTNSSATSRADRDQQVAIKLFLDISYSIVPQLQ